MTGAKDKNTQTICSYVKLTLFKVSLSYDHPASKTLFSTCIMYWIIFSNVLLTAKFLPCLIVKLTLSAFDIERLKWNCHIVIIRFHTRSDKHFISPCVSTKFQSKKIEVTNTFSKLPSLCCILLYLQEVCWKWTFLGRTLSFVEQIWHDIWT